MAERPDLYLVDKAIPFPYSALLGRPIQRALPQPVIEALPKPKKTKRFPRLRKAVGNIALATGVALGSGVAGVTFIETPVPVGPHDAGVTISYDGQLTIEAATKDGESSSISRDVDSPLGLGVHVTVDDLPFQFTKNNIIPTKISEEDLQAYASFFANYEDDIKNAEKEVRHSFEMYAALGAALFLSLRILKAEAKKRHMKNVSLGAEALGIVVLATVVGGPLLQIAADRSSGNPAALKDVYGFPLSEVGVEGRLKQFIRDDKESYDRIEENLKKQVEKHPSLFPADETTKVLIIEGLKCNAGMARIVGKAADLYKPAFILSAGDNEIGDESFFRDYCVRTLANQTEDHEIIESEGYHSAHLSDEEMKKYGRTELENKVIERNGIRIIGAKDQMPTGDGESNTLRAELGQRVSDTACLDEEGVMVAEMNEPVAADKIVDDGCVPVVIAGGFKEEFKLVTANNGEQVLYFLVESAGGAVYSEQPNLGTLGPLQKQAKVYVAYLDKKAGHNLLGVDSITAFPGDGKVTIKHRITAEGDSFLSQLDAENAAALQPLS